MQDILNELSKPIWWISVVAAGIIINLLSAYMKVLLDGFLSKVSAWWRDRSTNRKRNWDERVLKIRSSEQERYLIELEEVRVRLQSIHLSLIAILLLLMPVFMFTIGPSPERWTAIFFLGSSACIFLVSFRAFRDAVDLGSLLREAAVG